MPLASAMTAAHDAGAAGGVYYDRDGITLYCGDAHDLLPQLEGPFATITDPPYNAGKNYGVATNDRMPWPEWCAWWDGVLALLLPISPVILATLSQTAWREYTRLGKYPPNWTLVWSKPLSLAVCALPFMPHWEPIAYWGTATKRGGAFWGSDVLSHNVARKRYGHPTEKPQSLLIELVSNAGHIPAGRTGGVGTRPRLVAGGVAPECQRGGGIAQRRTADHACYGDRPSGRLMHQRGVLAGAGSEVATVEASVTYPKRQPVMALVGGYLVRTYRNGPFRTWLYRPPHETPRCVSCGLLAPAAAPIGGGWAVHEGCG